MKKLVFPIALIAVSLFSAALITTATAVTLASYSKKEKNEAAMAKTNVSVQLAAVSR